MQKILRIDPKDNLIVALRDLAQGDIIENDGQRILLVTDVPAKHKFTREPVPVGGIVTLYGVPVGKAVAPLQSGERITVDNVVHYAAEVDLSDAVPYMWKAPDVSRWGEPHVRRRDPPRRGAWGPRTIGSSSRWCSVRTATL